MYRQITETPRCQFCGGRDIHTFICWTQSQPVASKGPTVTKIQSKQK